MVFNVKSIFYVNYNEKCLKNIVCSKERIRLLVINSRYIRKCFFINIIYKDKVFRVNVRDVDFG